MVTLLNQNAYLCSTVAFAPIVLSKCKRIGKSPKESWCGKEKPHQPFKFCHQSNSAIIANTIHMAATLVVGLVCIASPKQLHACKMKLSNRKKNTRKAFAPKRQMPCPNCKQYIVAGEGHFVPPSIGEDGFFICQKN